ncbi:hypothetical protein EMIHUDRAFT_231400 [Emiliania huxleyi CCMP1516]|uniref:Glycine transporter domain-containing protein n=2 Tax=Emiliania huxleyi TaxID=2903 RepID=A0A0D3K7N7_EMIH1|nr:hypothetical protein EMIHUDRAFT_231400 [Emiliania huxleyi CCMP1516]EOD31772.1 hypothetical protein EMIHUDRAFT_231400 [Emiliania huxleyi CCMP1516]|eukprot:XP_005784201.1 hypothetical protein EMIHUDRAFT_231400 [Emiliania huxleyi CCMP1516]
MSRLNHGTTRSGSNGSFTAEGPQLSSLREDEQVSLPYPSADWESESGKEAWAARGRRVMVAFLLSAPLLLTLLLPKSIDEQHKLNHATVAAANYIGDASFALTGSLAAGMEGMDLLGCIIVGFITALGGGTLREFEYFLCVGTSTLAFFLWPSLSRRLKLTTADEWLFWTDTVGLGVFAANGALAAAVLTPRIHGVACACCGMFSATFGGLTRDVLLGRPPRILYAEADLYATPPFIGGLATAMLVRMDPEREADSVMLGFFVTVLLRVLAYNEPVRLPVFPASAIYSVDQRQKSRFFGEPSTARQASRWLSNASVYDSTVYDSMVSSVCDAVMAKAGQSSRASFVPSTFRQPLAPDAARGRESRCHLKGAISAVQAGAVAYSGTGGVARGGIRGELCCGSYIVAAA